MAEDPKLLAVGAKNLDINPNPGCIARTLNIPLGSERNHSGKARGQLTLTDSKCSSAI